MSSYLAMKLVHILSATVLFGTGIGIAFFMLRAYLSGDRAHFLAVSRQVVLADWLFTAPAVVIQFATGVWLANRLDIAYQSEWFATVMGLFAFVGFCWLPAVRIQLRLSQLAETDHGSASFHRLMKIWMVLGVLALLAMLTLFYLMVTKQGVGSRLFG